MNLKSSVCNTLNSSHSVHTMSACESLHASYASLCTTTNSFIGNVFFRPPLCVWPCPPLRIDFTASGESEGLPCEGLFGEAANSSSMNTSSADTCGSYTLSCAPSSSNSCATVIAADSLQRVCFRQVFTPCKFWASFHSLHVLGKFSLPASFGQVFTPYMFWASFHSLQVLGKF